jgi:uncharacterized protein
MELTRRSFLRTGGLLAAGAVAGWPLREVIASTARSTARGRSQDCRVSWHRVRWPGAAPVRLVHLTDLHLGIMTPSKVVACAVALAQELHPDVVVLTGDYVNHSRSYLGEVRRLVAKLPRPCFATLGNHDHWAGALAVRRALESEGVGVLANRNVTLPIRGARLPLIGVDDGVTRHDDVDRAFTGLGASPDHAVVLSHAPGISDRIAQRGGRLILSGHTHGGQLNLPLATRLVTKVGGIRYLSGWYRVGEARLYVSPGVGSSVLPFRLGPGTAPEIAVLDLLPQGGEI